MLYIHDSGRSGKLRWITDYVLEGSAQGVILNPFDTPPTNEPRRPSAASCVDAIVDAGGTALFDPATFALGFQGASRFDIYDLWGLWPGTRYDLSTNSVVTSGASGVTTKSPRRSSSNPGALASTERER